MSTNVLQIDKVSKSFDGVHALVEFSCAIESGEIMGLIGPNGAGKTTLLNVITGFIVPQAGRVALRGIDLVGRPPHRIACAGIARTFQDLRLVRQISVLDNVLLAFRDQPGERLRNVFFRRKMWVVREKRNKDQAVDLLKSTGLAEKAGDPAEALSYGQQKLLSLVCCLASGANLLLR